MTSKFEPEVSGDCEPGATAETMLVTTDSYERFEQEMSSSLDEKQMRESTTSTISEIQDAVLSEEVAPQIQTEIEEMTTELNGSTISNKPEKLSNSDEDYLQNSDWIGQKKHVFVLSSAGKPIYSRHGNEDKLVTTYGVMQVLVSFVQVDQDVIRSIQAGDTKFVFLVKGPLILVAVSKTSESVSQLILQLTYVFNQITSILTLTQLNRIYEQRRNYDLRRLLAGAERLIDHLLDFMEREPAFILGAVKCLPLVSSVRDSITNAIIQSCSKIKNLVFAILIAKNQLITLVRMKNYCIHPSDLHIIFNLVNSSESFKGAESWTPICLPKFDENGYLHTHVSYLAEDCQACLLLLTVDRYAFFTLSEAKQKIVEKLRRSNCLEPINESMNRKEQTCSVVGIPELRHFLYKCRYTAQFFSPAIQPPYTLNEETSKLLMLYQNSHHCLHAASRPLKLLYQQMDKENLLAHVTKGFELYAVFEPLTDIPSTTNAVIKLLKWIKKEEDKLFILNAPVF